MNLEISESQKILRDSFAKLFKQYCTAERIRLAEDSGIDRDLWNALVEFGAPLMRVPEAMGGGGMSLLDAVLAVGEAGRSLASVPLVEAIVASALIARLDDAGALNEALSSGKIATIAPHPALHPNLPLPGAAIADIIVLKAGEDVVALTSADSGSAMQTIFRNGIGSIAAEPMPDGAITLGSGPMAVAAFEAAVEEWKILTAASINGSTRGAIDLAASYAAERIQFGRPIGSFQGIAHPLADAFANLEGAELLVWRAIEAIGRGEERAPALLEMAWWWAGETARNALPIAVRTFGGYGVSLEYDAQLHYRRGIQSSLLLGDPRLSLDQIALRQWRGASAVLPQTGDLEISFDYGPAADAYARELRTFVAANMTPEIERIKHHSTSGFHAGFHKKLAAAGHAYPDLQSAGTTRSRYEVIAAGRLWEELDWTRTPIANTEFVARMVELWGSEDAKAEILPAIVNGDALGCLGFSEPGSGSDVFSARLSAVRDGDEWVLNGQKMFTTNANNGSYILMLARTNGAGKKHEGLTMFAMPMKVPGVEIHPVYTLQDEKTYITYYGDVRVPDKYRLGDVGDGARVMTTALGFEHGGSGYQAGQSAVLNHAIAWANRPWMGGPPPLDTPAGRGTLARAAVHEVVADLLCRRQVWADVTGIHNIAFGPMAKVFTTERMRSDAAAIVALAAPYSIARKLDPDLDFVETAMRRFLAMTIYGGTSEVHRSLIAEKGLGLPKSR